MKALLSLGLLVLPSPLQALHIQEIPSLLTRDSRDVRIADSDVRGAEHQESFAMRAFLPKIEVHTRWTLLDDDIVIDIGPQRVEKQITDSLSLALEVDPPPYLVHERMLLGAHLLVTQPIFAGGRLIAQKDAASGLLREAKAQRAITLDDRILEACTRYFQRQAAAAALEHLHAMGTHLDRMETITQALVRTGVAAKVALLQIAVARSEWSAKLDDVNRQLQLAEIALKTSLSMASTDSLTFPSELRVVPVPFGLDKFKADALQRRPEFEYLRAKRQQADALRRAKTGDMLPTIYAFGKHELLPDALTALDPLWAVGVGIDIPLSAGLTSFPERKRALELETKVTLLEEKAAHEIPLQVESAYVAAQSLLGTWRALKAARTQAAEVLRLSEARFRAGSGSTLELLKAQTDLESTVLRGVSTLESYNRRVMELYRYAGNLDAYLAAYAQHPQREL